VGPRCSLEKKKEEEEEEEEERGSKHTQSASERVGWGGRRVYPPSSTAFGGGDVVVNRCKGPPGAAHRPMPSLTTQWEEEERGQFCPITRQSASIACFKCAVHQHWFAS
jgi:hypothetical protein